MCEPEPVVCHVVLKSWGVVPRIVDFDNGLWDAGSGEVGTADWGEVFGCELGFYGGFGPFLDLRFAVGFDVDERGWGGP